MFLFVVDVSAVASTSTGSASFTSNSKNAVHQEKPSIFSHLMDPSPTESKQTLPPSEKESGSSSSLTQSVSKSDSAVSGCLSQI